MKLSAFDLLALEQFTEQERRAMMVFVMGSAFVDGHLDYREEDTIHEIASLLKITESDMQYIEDMPQEKAEQILQKMDNIKKILFGKFVATVIMADGVVDDREELLFGILVKELNIPMGN